MSMYSSTSHTWNLSGTHRHLSTCKNTAAIIITGKVYRNDPLSYTYKHLVVIFSMLQCITKILLTTQVSFQIRHYCLLWNFSVCPFLAVWLSAFVLYVAITHYKTAHQKSLSLHYTFCHLSPDSLPWRNHTLGQSTSNKDLTITFTHNQSTLMMLLTCHITVTSSKRLNIVFTCSSVT